MADIYGNAVFSVNGGKIRTIGLDKHSVILDATDYRRNFNIEEFSEKLDGLYIMLEKKESFRKIDMAQGNIPGLSYGGGFANVLFSDRNFYILASRRDDDATEPGKLDTSSGISNGLTIQDCLARHGAGEIAIETKSGILVPEFHMRNYSDLNGIVSDAVKGTCQALDVDYEKTIPCPSDIIPLENSVLVSDYSVRKESPDSLRANIAFLPDFMTINQLNKISVPNNVSVYGMKLHDYLGREVVAINMKTGIVRVYNDGEPSSVYLTEYLDGFDTEDGRVSTVDLASVVENISTKLGVTSHSLNPLLAGYEGIERTYPRERNPALLREIERE